uniref:Beta-lactamase-like protein 2 homolog n=1 Tax=Panagrellus redivivus TaxID=6233 RepID=A0A7E4W6N3_PANRE
MLSATFRSVCFPSPTNHHHAIVPMLSLLRNLPDYAYAGAAYFFSKTFHRPSMVKLTPLEDITVLTPLVTRVLGQNAGPFTLQGTNTYLVGAGKRKILIDAGEPNIESYIETLKKALSDGSTIDGIIATHWHGDHVGGIPDVLKLIGKEVPVYKYKRLEAADDPKVNYTFSDDNTVIKTDGATLKLIYTPGHTTDHFSVYLEEENILFSGDCILGEGTAIFEDLHTYMDSLNKYLEIKAARIFPGHGPVVEDPHSKINEYIEHRLKRERQIIASLRESASPLSTMDIVNSIYTDIPITVKLAAVANVKHHLTKLVKDGQVTALPYDTYSLVVSTTTESGERPSL